MQDETLRSAGTEGAAASMDGQVHPLLWAVNLVSDPIHGYIELTKRLTPERAGELGLTTEAAAEGDLLDSAWVQRMRRISQLQSARWVFPTAEHSRFTHGLGVMHEAGLWGRHLYPSLRTALAEAEPNTLPPSEGLVVETLRLAGLLHDVGHGPFAHFFDEHVLCHFAAPADPRRVGRKSLTHEDLSQLISATLWRRTNGSILAGSRSSSPSRPWPTRACRAGSAGCSPSCRASSPSTTWTTSAATPI
jgi:hypothetical protein